jgi:hypothetical protein
MRRDGTWVSRRVSINMPIDGPGERRLHQRGSSAWHWRTGAYVVAELAQAQRETQEALRASWKEQASNYKPERQPAKPAAPAARFCLLVFSPALKYRPLPITR